MERTYFTTDTIVASITGHDVRAALGVIRVSGKDAWSISSSLLHRARQGHQKFSPETVRSHHLYRCRVGRDPQRPLDDGMFSWMKAPRSFTGEDVVEIHLHGSPVVLRAVLAELVGAGAREALPGEFSFRAFRNGKLSLDQAEAVADLVASRSELGAQQALHALLGRTKTFFSGLRDRLESCLAELELDLDFSDQGLGRLDTTRLISELTDWKRDVEALRSDFLRSRSAMEGIRVALVGDPNSGKSSLFNRLVGEDRSIVSSTAGTTRDVVRELVGVEGLLFRMSDTAGLRQGTAEEERLGIERSYGELAAADLAIWVFDSSEPILGSASIELKRAAFRTNARFLAVWNKVDLEVQPPEAWLSYFQQRQVPVFCCSALTGAGISELLQGIRKLAAESLPEAGRSTATISRIRHHEVLGRASESVERALEILRGADCFSELAASELRGALEALGELFGEFSSEALLDRIFSDFCIGK